ncbi:alanine acetyltransferase [Paenibacillus yonginensis]|uniref:Alanine acetyltransferase n=1 Tax=Paenibacillus yonginensis TaxID=1462996 RepID=A0A1B1N375_9BACL|nr:GNAT family N-acetyltransferase [Paenibacillus yonginensis]ANS75856.1 alanine acetyltransferase [Paenibacillus yonginensis]
MAVTILHTDRLQLQSLTARDAAEVLAYLERNRQFLEPWEIRREASYYTLETQRRLLEEEADKMDSGQLFKLWFRTRGENGRIIGSAALSNIVRGAFLSCHLGYKLDEEERNKGYMTEALKAIIDFAFHKLGLHRIEANIMPRNAASLAVVHKLGFYHEGVAFKYLNINGVWEDHIHMVLRNEVMEQGKPFTGGVS